MKKIWVFLLGVLTGAILIIVLSVIVSKYSNNTESSTSSQIEQQNGVTMFPEVGECISEQPFKVFQALGNGAALANERSDSYGNRDSYFGLTVLFFTEGKVYYDDEIIKIPKGKCVRQVGVYKYETNGGMWKTVPIVSIFDK